MFRASIEMSIFLFFRRKWASCLLKLQLGLTYYFQSFSETLQALREFDRVCLSQLHIVENNEIFHYLPMGAWVVPVVQNA